jgi:hypothetical protein
VPLDPAVIVIHEALLAAVHEQPICVATLTDPDPLPALTELLVGLIE